MSVTIRWAHSPKGKAFDGGSSSDLAHLEELIGPSPFTVMPEHVPMLRGMARVSGFSKSFYAELADVVEEHGAIQVWGTW